MPRATSAVVYRQIQASGLLGRLQLRVYETLVYHGPLTIREAFERVGSPGVSLSPRFTELRQMGAIEEVGKRECKVSGNLATLWDVADVLPTPLPKPDKPGREVIHNALDEMHRLSNLAAAAGVPASNDFQQVYDWLCSKYES